MANRIIEWIEWFTAVFYVNPGLLIASAAILFFLFLFCQSLYCRKKAYSVMRAVTETKILGSDDLERMMFEFAPANKKVKLKRFNFTIKYRSDIAYRELNKIRDALSRVSPEIITLVPAARWLFDNFQIMYRELKKFNAADICEKRFPILLEGEFKGFPRVYAVAQKMVSLSGGYLDEDKISLMVNAYQKGVALTDAELWALPEMISLCLLESVISIANDVIDITETKFRADLFVKNKLRELGDDIDIDSIISDVEDRYAGDISFHSHVIYMLKNMAFDELSIQKYVESCFESSAKYHKPFDIFLEEGKTESSLEANIRVLITALNIVSDLDGVRLFEGLSTVEQILRMDPAGVYPEMDSKSRGNYRNVVEKLSLKYNAEEKAVAESCLDLAMQNREGIKCSNHVGAYLIGHGYRLLKAKILSRPEPKDLKPKYNFKGMLYFACIGISACAAFYILFYVLFAQNGMRNPCGSLFFLLSSFCIVVKIAEEATNNIFTRVVKVRELPALDYLKGIPDSARTFVVMPVIISAKEEALEYAARLERHYLNNRQTNLFFALLADFKDAPEEEMPDDEEIEELLIREISRLNVLYPDEHNRFALFIRYRKWNESEDCYMCWERKRGKLEEFNALLSGAGDTGFSVILCSENLLSTFKYVITLDSDSVLLKDNAAKLVGIIDHPLNRPVIDTEKKRVCDGYAIIQPSLTTHAEYKKSNLFYKIFAGSQGINHYATVISDIYHDVFDEGIFAGKGIYDVKAFHSILNKSIPENSVLSHDLLESCYVKTAFSGAVKIMESYPGSVISYAQREHRWIRGDWQLLPWLFNKKTLAGLSRWKILNNLISSLVPLSKVLVIILNIVLFPDLYYVWLPLIFGTDIIDLLFIVFGVLIQKIRRPKLTLVYKYLLKDIGQMLQRSLLEVIIAPYRAYIAADAILRTLYRLFKSRKHLLMWNTAESTERYSFGTKSYYFQKMAVSLIPPAIIVAALIVKTRVPVAGYIVYGTLSAVWGTSYLIAYYLGRPNKKSEQIGIIDDEQTLRDIARKTWQFFKDFSTSDNNWLCPDNYQYRPTEKIAYKTSPTNIGLNLLSVMSARDFGFETLGETVERLYNMLCSIEKLPKFRGHLFNWYNIKTFEVLNPQYISTVDSGNFFAYLITLKNGLLSLSDEPVVSRETILGLRDTIRLCGYEAKIEDDCATVRDFTRMLAEIQTSLSSDYGNRVAASPFDREITQTIQLIINEIDMFDVINDNNLSSVPSLRDLSLQNNKYSLLLIAKIEHMVSQIDVLLDNFDFKFLYDERRKLFHIGYNLSSQKMDPGCYDLVASESLLASFLAVSRSDVLVEHWYKLGRPLTIVSGTPCFVSWSGTMFEYLMPGLVMKEYDGSVFAETSKAAVAQHIRYAKRAGLPCWGISESQHYHFDQDSNYQYKAFGIPELRLQPSLSEPLVVAPYATMLALEYAKEQCALNIKKLMELGCAGDYGFYEAIDFSGPDPVAVTPYSIVKSYMAHHQGMIMVSINNFLHNGLIRERFHSEQMIKAAETLLEEKLASYFVMVSRRGYNIQLKKIDIPEEIPRNRHVGKTALETPVALFLSNDDYSLMITSDGDGFSDYNGMMLYRWRPDIYAQAGCYIYIKDIDAGRIWSSAYNPTKIDPDEYKVVFTPHQAEFIRRDGDISTRTVVSLSSNHDIEVRKVTITNNSGRKKRMELISYMEVVLDSAAAERAHPAFNKLFIESEFIEGHGIFLSGRRGDRSGTGARLMHMVKSNVKLSGNIEYENDRLRFIGRNNSVQNPTAVMENQPFSNSAEFSADPIMSLRVSADIEAESSASFYFITGICSGRDSAVKISEELSYIPHLEDINVKFKLQSAIELKYLNISGSELNAFQDLIGPIFYPSIYYRGPEESIRRNWRGQSDLWRFGISGDNPILLLRVKSTEDMWLIKDVFKAYEYLRINKVNVDLVIMSEAPYGYIQELDNLLNEMTSSLKIYDEQSGKPSLFLLHTYQMTPAETDLLLTVARIVFTDKTGIYFRNIKEMRR